MHTFPGQQPDESTLIVLHRHWAPFFVEALRFLALGLLPAGVWVVWSSLSGIELQRDSLLYVLLVMIAALYYLFLLILLYGFWIDYYLDMFLVTNKRVVDIEQDGLFSRTVAEQSIDRIQDVTSEMKGFFPSILRYGNIYIQTAGTQERFVFENVHNPEIVVKTILSLTDGMIRTRPATPPETPKKV